MKSRKKTLIAMAFACVALVVVFVVVIMARSSASYRDITVFNAEGSVKVERGGKSINAAKNMKLKSGDSIEVGEESFMRLCVDDDKYLYVDQNSELMITATGKKDNSRTIIEIARGQVIAEITNKLPGDSSYNTVTPNTTMAIRGTIIANSVRYDENGNVISQSIVLEGSASVGMYSGTEAIAGLAGAGEGIIFENKPDMKKFGKFLPSPASSSISMSELAKKADSLEGQASADIDVSVFDGLFRNIVAYVGEDGLSRRLTDVLKHFGPEDVFKVSDNTDDLSNNVPVQTADNGNETDIPAGNISDNEDNTSNSNTDAGNITDGNITDSDATDGNTAGANVQTGDSSDAGSGTADGSGTDGNAFDTADNTTGDDNSAAPDNDVSEDATDPDADDGSENGDGNTEESDETDYSDETGISDRTEATESDEPEASDNSEASEDSGSADTSDDTDTSDGTEVPGTTGTAEDNDGSDDDRSDGTEKADETEKSDTDTPEITEKADTTEPSEVTGETDKDDKTEEKDKTEVTDDPENKDAQETNENQGNSETSENAGNTDASDTGITTDVTKDPEQGVPADTDSGNMDNKPETPATDDPETDEQGNGTDNTGTSENEPPTPGENNPPVPGENEPPIPGPAENIPPTPGENEPPTPGENNPPTPGENEPTIPGENNPPTPGENEPPIPGPGENNPPTPGENNPPTPGENEPQLPGPGENNPPTPGDNDPLNPGLPAGTYNISLIYDAADETIMNAACIDKHIAGNLSSNGNINTLTFTFRLGDSQAVPTAQKTDGSGIVYDLVWKNGENTVTYIPSDISSDMMLTAEWVPDIKVINISISVNNTGANGLMLKDIGGFAAGDTEGTYTCTVNSENEAIVLPVFYRYAARPQDSTYEYDYYFYEADGYTAAGSAGKITSITYSDYRRLLSGSVNGILELTPAFKQQEMNVIEVFIDNNFNNTNDYVYFDSLAACNEMYIVGSTAQITKDAEFEVFNVNSDGTCEYSVKSLYYEYYTEYGNGNRIYPICWKNCKNNRGLKIGSNTYTLNNGITSTRYEETPSLSRVVGNKLASWALVPLMLSASADQGNVIEAIASGSAIKVERFVNRNYNPAVNKSDISVYIYDDDETTGNAKLLVGTFTVNHASRKFMSFNASDECMTILDAGIEETSSNSEKRLLIEFYEETDRDRYKLILEQAD